MHHLLIAQTLQSTNMKRLKPMYYRTKKKSKPILIFFFQNIGILNYLYYFKLF